MKITTYKTKLNEDKLNILVKESSIDYSTKESLSTPEAIFNCLNQVFDMQNLAEEYLYMIGLNNKNKPLGFFEISHGNVNASIANPREIFIRALLCGASSIILIHNHTSGNTAPSAGDIEVTKRIREAGELLGIALLDHIIIGDNFTSLKQLGFLNTASSQWKIMI